MATGDESSRLRRLAESVGLIDTRRRRPTSVRRFLLTLAIVVPICMVTILMFELMGLSGIAGGVGAAVAVIGAELVRARIDGSHNN